MKSFNLGSATIVAVALMIGPVSAQDSKGGPAAGGAAPAAGAEGSPGGGERMLPKGGAAGQASPGMKPAGGMQAEPGQRMKGENAGESPAQQPKMPGEPTEKTKGAQGEPEKTGNQEAEPAKKTGAETQKGQQTPAGENGTKKAGEARPAPKITNVQQTRIQQTIRSVDVRPVNVNFNIGVGVAVPSSVVLTPLPPAIITVVPEYEGYRFFVVPGQIVVVDPVTLDIVAVLPL